MNAFQLLAVDQQSCFKSPHARCLNSSRRQSLNRISLIVYLYRMSIDQIIFFLQLCTHLAGVWWDKNVECDRCHMLPNVRKFSSSRRMISNCDSKHGAKWTRNVLKIFLGRLKYLQVYKIVSQSLELLNQWKDIKINWNSIQDKLKNSDEQEEEQKIKFKEQCAWTVHDVN